MKVVTVITENDMEGLANFLRPSCEFNNLDLKVLICKGRYAGHRTKDLLLYEYLKGLQKNELIFFTDAFDAYFIGDHDEIVNKYYNFNMPVVFSGEIACWPEASLSQSYPKNTTDFHFRYLNSGGFIGTAGVIMDLIEKYYNGNHIDHLRHPWSNQYTWNQIYLKEQDLIQIDSNCEIFYTLCSTIEISRAYLNEANNKNDILDLEKARLQNEMILENGRFVSSITGRKPCHLHFNSPAVKSIMKGNLLNELKSWVNVS
jgi:hypothetical protein